MNAIINSTLFKENIQVNNRNILIEKGRVLKVTDKPVETAELLDATHQYVFPGFIDLQIYGAGGRLFSAEPTAESLSIMEDDLLKKGTTGFLACMATNSAAVFNTCIEAAKLYRSSARNFMGLHLEGPYLNPKRLGAHVPEFVRKASLDEVKALIDFGEGVIKMMTVAPEIQDPKVIEYLLDQGIIVSLGHSDASFEEATSAYNRGVQTTTHLFNAMSPIHHRAPGIPTAVFNHPSAMASIIPDGQHVDFEVVKFAQKLLRERLFLITDAVTACNTGPYQHIQSGDKFVMPDGTLSGSSLTMAKAVKNCVEEAGISLAEACKMASLYPAQLIAEAAKGKIEPGAEASFVLMDHQLNLKEVIFKGQRISIDK